MGCVSTKSIRIFLFVMRKTRVRVAGIRIVRFETGIVYFAICKFYCVFFTQPHCDQFFNTGFNGTVLKIIKGFSGGFNKNSRATGRRGIPRRSLLQMFAYLIPQRAVVIRPEKRQYALVLLFKPFSKGFHALYIAQ